FVHRFFQGLWQSLSVLVFVDIDRVPGELGWNCRISFYLGVQRCPRSAENLKFTLPKSTVDCAGWMRRQNTFEWLSGLLGFSEGNNRSPIGKPHTAPSYSSVKILAFR